jgi:hypothetical protein
MLSDAQFPHPQASSLGDARLHLITLAVLIAGALALSGLDTRRATSPLVPWHACGESA